MKTVPLSVRLPKYLGLLLLIVGGTFPLVWIALTSLKSGGELQQFPVAYLPTHPAWSNYCGSSPSSPSPPSSSTR